MNIHRNRLLSAAAMVALLVITSARVLAADKAAAGGGKKLLVFPEEALANSVAKAQREAARAPELAGTVAAVESWPLTTPEVAIWRMKKDAARANEVVAETELTEQQWPLYGSNLGYHYDGSGRFFIRLGDEFATAMLKLMGPR